MVRGVPVFALALLLTTLQAAPAPPAAVRQGRRSMGTYFEIQAFPSGDARVPQAIGDALDEVERVDRLLTNYDRTSELSVMNRDAAVAPARVSEELFAFVARCRQYVDDTSHAFDPTVGPLVRAWGFFSPRPARPLEADIEAARARSGFDKVTLDRAARTVAFATPGMEIDPGGIGKGYALDRAAAVLARHGVTAALLSAGGSTLLAVGHPPDRAAWRVAIRNPIDPDAPYAIVDLRDASLSTSGVSEKSVQVDGRRFGHIFDPRVGAPVEGMCQATIVAPTATDSDALSKPAFILSRAEIVRLYGERRTVHVLRVEGECAPRRPVWITPWSSGVFHLGGSAGP